MAMEPSNSSHEEQQQQQQEKKASQLFAQRALQERRLKPPDQVVPCPRCQSLNTKFCYYNNYSLTQPRHFCKNCRRYWTAGGTLRNVPVGGGCRKNKRAKHRNADGLQPSSGTANTAATDFSHVAAAAERQQQHTQLGSSSSAGFFDSDHGVVHFVTSQEHQQQQQQPTWSQQEAAITPNVEAGSALAFTHSGQGPNLSSHHSQPFASGIMSLGLFNAVKPDAAAGGLSMHSSSQQVVHGGGDLTTFFDNSAAYSRLGNLAALNEGHGSLYNHSSDAAQEEASSYARGSTGDVWRNLQQQQQPKQEVLWGQEADSPIQGSSASLDLNRQQASKASKFSTPSLSPAGGHGLLDAESKAIRPAAVGWQEQQQQQSASHHQGDMPNYETVSPEAPFWSNPGWPPLDLHALHGSGGPRLL